MDHYVMVTNGTYKTKTKEELISENIIAKVKNELGWNNKDNLKHLSMIEIKQYLNNGHSFIFSRLNKGISGASQSQFDSSSLLPLDVESRGLFLDDLLAICKEYKVKPALIYTTKSHSKEDPRYRMLFALDEAIKNSTEYHELLARLIAIFKADKKCCDNARVYYPGKACVYADTKAINKKTAFQNLPVHNLFPPKKDRLKTKKNVAKINYNDSNPFLKAIKTLDAKSLQRLALSHLQKRLKDMPQAIENTSSQELETKADHILKYNNILRIWSAFVGNLCDLVKPMGSMGSKDQFCKWEGSMPSNFNENSCLYYLFSIESSKSSAFLGDIYANKTVNPHAIYDIVEHLDMSLLLGAEPLEMISCIFDDHIDTNPSARIEYTKRGRQVYNCYSCSERIGEHYDLIDLVEILSGCDHYQAKKFVLEVLGLKITTDWLEQKKKSIRELYHFIDGGQMEKQFPVLYNGLKKKRLLRLFKKFLDEADRYVFDKEIMHLNGNPVFFTSTRRVRSILKDEGYDYGYSITAIKAKLRILSTIGLLTKVHDNDLDNGFADYLKSKAKAMHRGVVIRYHHEVLSVPEFTIGLIASTEEQYIQKYEKERLNIYKQTSQTEYFNYGKSHAEKTYTQTKKFEIPEGLQRFYVNYKKNCRSHLKKYGYISESEIVSYYKGQKKNIVLNKAVQCRPRIVQDLNLISIRYNKKIEKNLNIPKNTINYGAFIMIPEEKGKEVMK